MAALLYKFVPLTMPGKVELMEKVECVKRVKVPRPKWFDIENVICSAFEDWHGRLAEFE